MAIDLSFTEPQLRLQATAHEYFERRCPTSVVRDVETGGLGYQPDMWQEMAELGWLGITYPDAYGGSGGGFLDMYPLYEEIGRFLVPSPHLDTVVVGGETLLEAGSEAQRLRLLPAVTAARCIISPAILEPNGTFGPGGVNMLATRRNGGYGLSGTKLLVGFASSADYFLVAARTSGSGSPEGLSVFLVETSAAGLSHAPLPNIAGGALSAVEFDDVVVPADSMVGDEGTGWAPLSAAMTKAAVLQTATIVGAARRVLEMTNQYAKDREQFGSPIGRYQAVQYMVSDVLIDMHRVDLLAKQAAYRIDVGKPYGREAAMAIAFGKKAAAHLHRQAHEVHAGVGFMLDHDLNLFSRRSKYWENNLGDARYHQEQLARQMGL
jgi:alkylation response protein AidB-like acyl-CoA dehydrogenase